MQLPNDVTLFLEDCEEHGYVPGAEQFGNRFDEIYGTQQVNEWLESLQLPEIPQALPEQDSLPSTPYSHPHFEMEEEGLSWNEFIEEVI